MWSEVSARGSAFKAGLIAFGLCAALLACTDRTKTDARRGAEDRAPAAPAPEPDDAGSAALDTEDRLPASALQPVGPLSPLNITDIAGGWRVASSSRDGSRIVGAIAEIYPESIAWSYLPEAGMADREVCSEPVLLDLEAERDDGLSDRVVAELLADTGLSPRSSAHEVKCAGGGSLGAEAGSDLVLTRSGRLVMRWKGEEVLVLQRLKR